MAPAKSSGLSAWMMPAPTNEIAIGRKISVFAKRSSLDRSASTATASPKPVDNVVPRISQMTLFRESRPACRSW